ncbi:MAG: cytidyltransferase-related domain protein [Eubacterium sp.]|jgi:nicotinic acid mononucleotide adenylyltransferase
MTHKQQIRAFSQKIMESLEDRAFLKQAGLPKSAIESAFTKSDLEEAAGALLPVKSRISCAEVLKAFETILGRLSDLPDEGLEQAAYDFARGSMFSQEELLDPLEPYRPAIYAYLKLLQIFLDEERTVVPFDPMTDFRFLTNDEAEKYANGESYVRFMELWRSSYIYEMLRLGEDVTTFHTLGHIAGVHFVATTAAKGLADAGIPIDLALAGAAAAAHDLGKFGCRPGERVPYLHYYYTDKWCRENGLDDIGHIGANHSTWDLELDHLSAESLCLIYADFRVKEKQNEKGENEAHIFNLKESFDVILSKLDNVDDEKLHRYKFVYSKLADFEDYMRCLGVDVDLTGRPGVPEEMPDIALRNAEQTLKSLKFMSINHNIRVMNTLATERKFGKILEEARSEKNFKHLRAYLIVLQEYSIYLSFSQKRLALEFLCELLTHREGDVRRFAAALVGQIIAEYNAGYRKMRPEGSEDVDEETAIELWNRTLDRITIPDIKLTDRHRSWLGYTLKIIVGSLFAKANPDDKAAFFRELMKRYTDKEMSEDSEFALLDTLHDMPLELADASDLKSLTEFALRSFAKEPLRLRMAALRYFEVLTDKKEPDDPALKGIAEAVNTIDYSSDDTGAGKATQLFLKYRILTNLRLDTGDIADRLQSADIVSEIFLDNLKSSTHWTVKATNIELLEFVADSGKFTNILQIATHLANLIKVSEIVAVRIDAGETMLRLVKYLTTDQRNEIAVELVKGLEVGEYEFSKYIPPCLGRFVLWLPPDQLDELIAGLRTSMASPNERIASLALETTGIMLEHYDEYKTRFPEQYGKAETRRESLLGFILSGMANYRIEVRREAMWALTNFYTSDIPDEAAKEWVISIANKKIMFLMRERNALEMNLYYRAALLSHINRFMSVYNIDKGDLATKEYEKVAFFPGTFDPFTLSHKAIACLIRDLGYEVFLAVDEFSWSKNTQPNLVRRQIINMSVADEFHIHLFPTDIPINIANPEDIKTLKKIFEGRDLYLVVGEDVIRDASAYKTKPTADSVHSLNHIIFSRQSKNAKARHNHNGAGDASAPEASIITGKIVNLRLPDDLDDVSSSKIRENLDMKRDISTLIDPVVQEYIYSDNRYLREDRYKKTVGRKTMFWDLYEKPEPVTVGMLRDTVLKRNSAGDEIARSILSSGDSLLVMRNVYYRDPVGFVRFKCVESGMLQEELGSVELADEIRRKSACGRLLLIRGIYAPRLSALPDPEQWLLSQVIIEGLSKNCNFAAYVSEPPITGAVRDVLERQGFVAADNADEKNVMIVNMYLPLILLQNLDTTLKEPFASSPEMQRVFRETHKKFQSAATKLFPGQLVLSIHSSMLMEEIVTKMTALNGVPREQTEPRQLGPLMCVPFGKLMRGFVVPNTVTKTLHTDKVFNPELTEYKIEAFPGYTSLETQVKAIKSFGRPVVLIDDILYRPGRLQAILPLFKKEGIEVKCALLGLLSGYGRDTISSTGVKIDAVVRVPSLRRWFIESTLYPFIGGDTVRRSDPPGGGISPAVNFILPYAVPRMPGCSEKALFDFSQTILENDLELFLTLEAEFSRRFGRNLTLGRLGEAVILPLCPDRGSCLSYDLNLLPSDYLVNDLTMLKRDRRLLSMDTPDKFSL